MSESRPLRRACFWTATARSARKWATSIISTVFKFFPFAAEAIRQLNQAEIPVIVVTNQSGIARNIFPESLVHEVHKKMDFGLAAGGAWIDGIYFCPHKRKTRANAANRIPACSSARLANMRSILAASWVVGDRYADLEMAHAAGGRGILVMTGYGRGEYELHRATWPRQPDALAENLTEAVRRILND